VTHELKLALHLALWALAAGMKVTLGLKLILHLLLLHSAEHATTAWLM